MCLVTLFEVIQYIYNRAAVFVFLYCSDVVAVYCRALLSTTHCCNVASSATTCLVRSSGHHAVNTHIGLYLVPSSSARRPSRPRQVAEDTTTGRPTYPTYPAHPTHPAPRRRRGCGASLIRRDALWQVRLPRHLVHCALALLLLPSAALSPSRPRLVAISPQQHLRQFFSS